MEDYLCKPMITAKELSASLEINYIRALEVVNTICREMEENGSYVLRTKPQRVPTHLVKKKLNIK